MTGDPAVIAAIQAALRYEWALEDIYAALRGVWRVRGYVALHRKARKWGSRHRQAVKRLAKWLAYLGGTISFDAAPVPYDQAASLVAQLAALCELESAAYGTYKAGMTACLAAGDHDSYDILESPMRWIGRTPILHLEAWLSLSRDMGEQNLTQYLVGPKL